MKATELNKSSKFLLGIDDIARLLSIGRESAKVTASRYFKKGILIRIKPDVYIEGIKFDNLKEEDLFRIANIIQTPSYVSLTTALSYYNITTQQTRNFIESISFKRTKEITLKNISFTFSIIKEEFYYGFELKNNFFIASPEKAFADAVYLSSLKRYNCDFSAVNFKKLDKNNIIKYFKNTNDKTITFWNSLCRTYKI
jgi:predicted transcriptional regulator of viral defense system